ncbi:hypothetical protein B0H11DRAFT_2275068 [Mycena galericulata]|nr:hypothetical protein B0H11DRAFT_2275068 [Mycena galericulata]
MRVNAAAAPVRVNARLSRHFYQTPLARRRSTVAYTSLFSTSMSSLFSTIVAAFRCPLRASLCPLVHSSRPKIASIKDPTFSGPVPVPTCWYVCATSTLYNADLTLWRCMSLPTTVTSLRRPNPMR